MFKPIAINDLNVTIVTLNMMRDELKNHLGDVKFKYSPDEIRKITHAIATINAVRQIAIGRKSVSTEER